MFSGWIESNEVRFPTGNCFRGKFDKWGMQGYGEYFFIDGTKYTGRFLNNKFHGEGTITMPESHGICFRVQHHEGKLKEISGISFEDKLEMDFQVKGKKLSFEGWTYCTRQDRRFNDEALHTLPAVGPLTYQTAEGPDPEPLSRNHFDIGFGEFNSLGCVVNMPKHLTKTPKFYVGSRPVRRWIRENCRHGELRGKQLKEEVLERFERQIMQNNLQNEEKLARKSVKRKMKVCPRSSSLDSCFSSSFAFTSDSSDVISYKEPFAKTRVNIKCKKHCPNADPATMRRTKSVQSLCHLPWVV